MQDSGIGERLRNEREGKGLTIEKISDELKIQTKHLEAMEEEDFEALPGEVFVKAFLRTYSKYLGLNQEEILNEYLAAKTEKPEDNTKPLDLLNESNREERGRYRHTHEPNRKKEKLVSIAAIILIIALFIVLGYLVIKKINTSSGSKSEIVDVNDQPSLILEAEALEEVWVEITPDKEGVQKMLLTAGEKKEWEAKEQFIVTVGKKTAVKLVLNGKQVNLDNYKSVENVVRDILLKNEEKKIQNKEVTKNAK